jgi:hypothetical protein
MAPCEWHVQRPKDHEIRHSAIESDITFTGNPSQYKQNVGHENRAPRGAR